jgi:hypothetical protein
MIVDHLVSRRCDAHRWVWSRYEHKGALRTASVREEWLDWKGNQAGPAKLLVAETVHGPIISGCGLAHDRAYSHMRGERGGEAAEGGAGTVEIAFCAKGRASRLVRWPLRPFWRLF